MDGRRVARPPHDALVALPEAFVAMGTASPDDPTGTNLRYAATRLLGPATEYVRWLEATGERPDAGRVRDVVTQTIVFGDDATLAWSRFGAAVDASCLSPAPPAHPTALGDTTTHAPTPSCHLRLARPGAI